VTRDIDHDEANKLRHREHVLSEEKKQQVIALGKLGWSLRRIQRETGVRRETAASYLKSVGIVVREPGAWGHKPVPETNPAKEATADSDADSKPAIEVTPDFGAEPAGPGRSPSASVCEPWREWIEARLAIGRNAKAIWQELVDDSGFAPDYQSVERFVRKLYGSTPRQACAIIETPPGEEAQVDYGEGPMVRDPNTGKYCRTRLFVLTLGYSRKSIRLLTFKSSGRIWAELHEQAFRRLGGCVRIVVLDNLREGVLKRGIHDPALNPLYRDLLTHYGSVALPCRVGHPDRKACVSYCTLSRVYNSERWLLRSSASVAFDNSVLVHRFV
jgi:transposase